MAAITPIVPSKDQYDPLGQGQTRPRRGLFGGRAMGILRREDGDPGTAWNYFLFGQNGVRGMREDRMARDLFGMRRAAFEQEQKEAEQQRADQEAAIAALDPSMQPWARLAPEAAARAALAGPEAPDWQTDPVTGQPYTITPQGQVRYGEGRVNVRQGGGGMRAPPAGYRWTDDGGLEAIPGGPADLRANETGRRRSMALQDSADNLQNVLGAIDEALPQISGETTGLRGQLFRGMGGTTAYDLREAIEPIVANLGFEALAEMRRNSETGGALGQVAVRELDLLQRTVRSLDTAQSQAQLRRNMTEVRTQVARTLAAVRAAQREMQQGAGEAPMEEFVQEPGDAEQQPRRRTWTPERGLH